MPEKLLRYSEGTSKKFWKIKRTGSSQSVAYGREGSTGRTVSKEFETVAEAKASFERLVAQKLKKGYEELARPRRQKKKASKGVGGKRAKAGSNAKPRAAAKKTDVKRGKTKPGFFKPLSAAAKRLYEPLTAATLRQFEKRNGVKLPTSLVKLLKKQNGGYLQIPTFEFGKECFELEEIPPVCGEGGLQPLSVGYPDHVEMAQGKLPKPHLIFPLCGDGHYFIALDYRSPGSEPRVIYLDIEGSVSQKTIASSFEKFLAGQCKPQSLPRVRVDLADQETQIAFAAREYVMDDPHTGKPIRCEERHWLFLSDTQVECFEYSSRRKQVGRGKFGENPDSEYWDRHYAKLTDLSSVTITNWNALWTRRKVLDVSTSPFKRGVYRESSSRENGGKWKNSRGGPIIYFYYHGMPKSLRECKPLIEAAMKRAQRKR